MEAALREKKYLITIGNYLSFNPCCSGSGPAGFAKNELERRLKSFNPCCSGSGPAGIKAHIAIVKINSFNPCCSGSGPAGFKIYIASCAWIKFQSLL